MPVGQPLDYEALRERVAELLAAGKKVREAARELGISKTSVCRIRDLGRSLCRHRELISHRSIAVSVDMRESRNVRERDIRASRLFAEDLRREHPERKI